MSAGPVRRVSNKSSDTGSSGGSRKGDSSRSSAVSNGGAHSPSSVDTELTPLNKGQQGCDIQALVAAYVPSAVFVAAPSPSSSSAASGAATAPSSPFSSSASFPTAAQAAANVVTSANTKPAAGLSAPPANWDAELGALTPAAAVAWNKRAATLPRTCGTRMQDAVHVVYKVIMSLYMFFTGLTFNAFQSVGWVLFYFPSKALFRRYCNFTHYYFSGFLTATLETLAGMTPHYYGDVAWMFDDSQRIRNAILISNHTSYADWVVLFATTHRKGAAASLRIFLKSVAAVIPGIGWSTVLGEYFLVAKSKSKGDWERDGQAIVNKLKSFVATNSSVWPTIFPEGTFHDRADATLVERTHQYAIDNKLPVLSFLLTPRARGFLACVQNLRGHATHVVDLTLTFLGTRDQSPHVLQYVGALPLDDPARLLPDASDCSSLRAPAQVHIYVRLFSLDTVPNDEDGVKAWLYNRWIEKEALLRYFNQHGAFPGACRKSTLSLFSPDWMIYYPAFFAVLAGLIYLLVTKLPGDFLRWGGLLVLIVSVLGIVTNTFCKQR